MRTIILMMIGAFLSLSFITTKSIKTSYSIEELIKNPAFDVSVKSNGLHSGKSVLLDIKSNSTKNINLKIPAGTLFYPDNDNEQTLVSPREEIMVINKKQVNNNE